MRGDQLTVLAATELTVPALAAPAYRPPHAQREKPVRVQKVPSATRAPAVTGRAFAGPAPVWPAAGTAELDLAAPVTGSAPAVTRAGGLPLRVERVAGPRTGGATAPGRVRVETLGQDAARAAGFAGILLRLSTLDNVGPVRLTVDYSAFASAHGPDWSSRLRLVPVADRDRPGPAMAGPGVARGSSG